MSTEIQTEEQTKISLKPPSLWKVVFLNDDSTPMEFVIELLVTIFKHNAESAKDITLEVHNSGSAVVGVYTYEIAEQKGVEATALSRANGYPLQINIEEE
jgi:ATP-dependent Clp protease adaptor protein ClpS